MGGKRGAQLPGSGDEVSAQGGESLERQMKRLSVDGAAGSEDARTAVSVPTFDAAASTELPGRECSVEWTRVGPLEWGLECPRSVRSIPVGLRVLSLKALAARQCLHKCLREVGKPWRWEIEAMGFCKKTVQLCSALAEGGDLERHRLGKNVLQQVYYSAGDDSERAVCMDACAFLKRSWGFKGSLHEWLQVASQEPDASFLSRGATSTAQILGLPLVEWVGKPQGRYPGLYTLAGHSGAAETGYMIPVAFSPDGKRVVSGWDGDNLVKIWNAETGAEVGILDRGWGRVMRVAICGGLLQDWSGTGVWEQGGLAGVHPVGALAPTFHSESAGRCVCEVHLVMS